MCGCNYACVALSQIELISVPSMVLKDCCKNGWDDKQKRLMLSLCNSLGGWGPCVTQLDSRIIVCVQCTYTVHALAALQLIP